MKALTSPMGRRHDSGSVASLDMALEYRCRAGAYMRDLRLSKDMRQSDLCDLIGFGSTALSNIERGHTALASDRWDDMADALGVDRKEFVKVMLRYSNPWAYRTLFGQNDMALAAEIDMIPKRYFNLQPGQKRTAVKRNK